MRDRKLKIGFYFLNIPRRARKDHTSPSMFFNPSCNCMHALNDSVSDRKHDQFCVYIV